MTQEEQYLLTFVPQITADTDPLQEEIDSRLKDYEDKWGQLEAVIKADDELQEVPKPDESKKPGCGVPVVVAIVLFVLLLIFGVPFLASLILGAAGAAVLYGVLSYDYKSKVDDYNNYVKTREQYRERMQDLDEETSKLWNYLSPKLDIRFETLRVALNKNLGIPYPKSAITLDNYSKVKKCYLALMEKSEEVNHIPDNKEQEEANRAFIDEKLTFLYAHSLRATVSDDVYGEFKQQLLNAGPGKMLMRQEIKGRYSQGVSEIMRLPKYKDMLEDDHLTPIINKFEAVSRRNTRGFLFDSTDKKEAQTRDMAELFNAAKYEYDELMDISKKVSYALNYARGCAFRNIYLATELINYIVGSNRGGGLTTAQDGIDFSSVNTTDVSLDSFELNGSSIESAVNTVAFLSDAVMDNAALSQLVDDNPKFAAGVAIVAAVGAGVVQYLENLEKNAEAQKQLTDNIQAIADGYTEGKANMLRAIEIIGGIVKCNDGFMAVYEPLRKKVFEDGDTNLTKMEIMQLAAAANEYSKTAKAKIKE